MPESVVLKEKINLAPYHTIHVQVRAKSFIDIRSEQQIQDLIDSKKKEDEPHFILGGGSNVLFLDDFDGIVMHVAIKGREVIEEDDNYVWLKIGAGENWHQTVRYCVRKGWGGIENLSLIPGTVGAAPIQNIGAYGVELKDVFDSLEAIDLHTGETHRFNRTDCKFGYRDSIFKHDLKNNFMVSRVTLRLAKKPVVNTSYGAIQAKLDEKAIAEPTIRDISNVVIEIRNSKLPDPVELPNAGSFFKNPVISTKAYDELKKKYPSMPGYSMEANQIKVPAGWLIEQAGWKGKEIGNVGTYRQQALVIINHGGATGQEILALAQNIQQSVREKFDIELVPEVNIVGSYA